MIPTRFRTCLPAALLLAGAVVPAAAQAPSAKLELVGRGPVTHTRTTGLAVFRGVDGRDYAYTGTFGACQGCVPGRMYAWDVSDPAHPRLSDSVVVDAQRINSVAVNAAGTLAVIARDGARTQRNGIVVLDLADPGHPKIAADYWETLTGGVQNVWIDGTNAYVVDHGTSEMAVIDLSNPRDPIEMGRWGIPDRPGRFLQDVSVKDGLAYLSYWDDGLVILDVGNGVRHGTPRQPKLVSQYAYRSTWHGERYGQTAFALPYTSRSGKKYVFVTDQILPPGSDLNRRFETGGYVHVLDISNVQQPQEVASYAAPNSGVHSFWVANDTMYVAAWTGGLRAVDVSGELKGSLNSRELASLITADDQAAVHDFPFAWAAMPHNGLVYATDFNSGLWIARVVPARTAATNPD